MNSDGTVARRTWLCLGVAYAAMLAGSLTWAQQPQRIANIQREPLASAMTELAHETGMDARYSPGSEHEFQPVLAGADETLQTAFSLLPVNKTYVLKDPIGARTLHDRIAAIGEPALTYAAAGQAGEKPIVPAVSQVAAGGDQQTAQGPEDERDASRPEHTAVARTSTELEEVVVTAQKREESLQETPIAITAFGARELETQRVANVMDLLNKVPSLNLAPFAATRGAPNLFIRGMGNLNSQTTKDNATGIYIDGVPVGRSVGLATDIADLERVEVLRGPQGTLYGRNTTAGAINFITQKPDEQLAFGVQATAGNWGLRSGRMTLNAPLTASLFVRAAYMRSENNGWVENLNTALPNQINFNEDRKKEAIRLATRFRPTENFTADYSFDSSEMIFGNHFYQIIAGPTAVPGRQESANRALGLHPSKMKVSGHNLTLALNLRNSTLKSITAYRKLDAQTHMNYIGLFTQANVQNQDQISQEVQLVGDTFWGRLKYAMGLFYFEEDSNEALTSAYGGGALLDIFHVAANGRSAAIYGQATWTPPVLNDHMGLTLGMRYTEDSRKAVKTFDHPGLAPAFQGLIVAGDRDFSSFDPAVTIDYNFTDSVSSYAKFSTGYRAGGYNTQSLPTFFGLGFAQETVEAWELGVKSELLERRLRLNVAAFRNKYDDLQVDQARTPPIYADTLNAGGAEIKGIELESTAILAQGLSVNFYYSLLDGKYNSYIDNGVELASVRHIQNAPKWHFGAGVDYEFPQTALGNLSLHIDYRKQDEFYSGPIANTLSPGYQIWNARLQLASIPVPGRGSFRIAAWGKNLSDEIYRLSTTNLGIISAQFGAPRSAGVDLVYEF